jgi:hypothetical protein
VHNKLGLRRPAAFLTQTVLHNGAVDLGAKYVPDWSSGPIRASRSPKGSNFVANVLLDQQLSFSSVQADYWAYKTVRDRLAPSKTGQL